MVASTIPADIMVIGDDTPEHHYLRDDEARGLELSRRARSARPDEHAYGGLADPFPSELLIDESAAMAMIQERKERKVTNRDRAEQCGVKQKNQAQTNFCWVNAPTHCVEIVKAFQCGFYEELSAASVACKINGFRNEGGWGKDALEFMIKSGIVPARLWPNAAISRQYDTQANWELAKDNIVVEWWECRPRTLQEVWSVLLRGFPGAGGYNWWSHEITNYDPEIKDGKIVILCRNQWISQDWLILEGRKAEPDDFVAPRLIM
jgi:hypothetical protein